MAKKIKNTEKIEEKKELNCTIIYVDKNGNKRRKSTRIKKSLLLSQLLNCAEDEDEEYYPAPHTKICSIKINEDFINRYKTIKNKIGHTIFYHVTGSLFGIVGAKIAISASGRFHTGDVDEDDDVYDADLNNGFVEEDAEDNARTARNGSLLEIRLFKKGRSCHNLYFNPADGVLTDIDGEDLYPYLTFRSDEDNKVQSERIRNMQNNLSHIVRRYTERIGWESYNYDDFRGTIKEAEETIALNRKTVKEAFDKGVISKERKESLERNINRYISNEDILQIISVSKEKEIITRECEIILNAKKDLLSNEQNIYFRHKLHEFYRSYNDEYFVYSNLTTTKFKKSLEKALEKNRIKKAGYNI
jgi:hypothetical protein